MNKLITITPYNSFEEGFWIYTMFNLGCSPVDFGNFGTLRVIKYHSLVEICLN